MHAERYTSKNETENLTSQEQLIETSDACSTKEIVQGKTLNHVQRNSVVWKFYNQSNTLGQ